MILERCISRVDLFFFVFFLEKKRAKDTEKEGGPRLVYVRLFILFFFLLPLLEEEEAPARARVRIKVRR